MSLAVLSRAACASMSTTTTTTTTRDRGDRYGPMEWAQQDNKMADHITYDEMERDIRIRLGAARIPVVGLLCRHLHDVPLYARVIRTEVDAALTDASQLIFACLPVSHIDLHFNTSTHTSPLCSTYGCCDSVVNGFIQYCS